MKKKKREENEYFVSNEKFKRLFNKLISIVIIIIIYIVSAPIPNCFQLRSFLDSVNPQLIRIQLISMIQLGRTSRAN